MLKRSIVCRLVVTASLLVVAVTASVAAERPRPGMAFLGGSEKPGVLRIKDAQTTVPRRPATRLGQRLPNPDSPKNLPKPGANPGAGDVSASPRRPPRNEPVKPSVRLVCDGGRVVVAACICPAGERLQSAGVRRFSCQSGTASKPNRAPPVVVLPEPKPGSNNALPRPTRDPQRDPRITRPPTFLALPGGRLPPPTLPPAMRALPLSGPIPSAPLATRAAAGGEVLPNEIIFTLAASATPADEDDVARRHNIQILERVVLPVLGVRVVRSRWPAVNGLPAVMARIRSDPRIVDVQANYIYRPSQGPSLASVNDLQYALAKVDLGDTHAVTTGQGARIAIIDSGVDRQHPDFSGLNIETFDALGGANPDAGTHGTAIAGIISARGTLRGIAPAATLMSIRAFPSDRGPQPQMTTTVVLLKAMDWSVANGARILNLSLAGPRDPLMQKAIAAIAVKGVIMVAAAGNNGDQAPPAYPAAYPDVIAVTAIDAQDQIYARANQGTYIAIAAPGVDVLTATRDNGHALQSGTSFAAAHVSGILALMLERNPALTASEARRALMESAVDLGAPGRDNAYGAGRTSASAALRWVAR